MALADVPCGQVASLWRIDTSGVITLAQAARLALGLRPGASPVAGVASGSTDWSNASIGWIDAHDAGTLDQRVVRPGA